MVYLYLFGVLDDHLYDRITGCNIIDTKGVDGDTLDKPRRYLKCVIWCLEIQLLLTEEKG